MVIAACNYSGTTEVPKLHSLQLFVHIHGVTKATPNIFSVSHAVPRYICKWTEEAVHFHYEIMRLCEIPSTIFALQYNYIFAYCYT